MPEQVTPEQATPEHSSPGPAARTEPGLPMLATLVAMTALGPLAMQMFIPALPLIQDSFQSARGETQLVLSLSMLSIAISTLFHGPLSDRFGRRSVLLVGIGAFLAGSLVCAWSPSLPVLVSGRILQAIGGAAGMVVGRALVHDLYGRERGAEMLAWLTMVMVVAPMVAPLIGGYLTELHGWRVTFYVTAGSGLLVLLAIFHLVPETNHQPVTIPGPAAFIQGFGQLWRVRAFRGYSLQGAFSFAAFFAFISGAPYIMADILHRSADDYGLYFALVAGGFMAGNFIAARLSRKTGGDNMILIGSIGAFLSILTGTTLITLLPWSALLLFLPMTSGAFFNGLTLPNSQAGAVHSMAGRGGTASGLMGFMQMGGGALMSQLVGLTLQGTPYPMFGLMLFSVTAALLSFLLLIWFPARRAVPA